MPIPPGKVTSCFSIPCRSSLGGTCFPRRPWSFRARKANQKCQALTSCFGTARRTESRAIRQCGIDLVAAQALCNVFVVIAGPAIFTPAGAGSYLAYKGVGFGYFGFCVWMARNSYKSDHRSCCSVWASGADGCKSDAARSCK